MSSLDCSVCYEKTNNKKIFTCNNCKVIICKSCLRDCIITYGNNIPKCPNCLNSISFELLAKLYSKSFINNDLMEHIANIQFDVITKEKVKSVSNTLIKVCNYGNEDVVELNKSTILNTYLNYLENYYVNRISCEIKCPEHYYRYANIHRTIGEPIELLTNTTKPTNNELINEQILLPAEYIENIIKKYCVQIKETNNYDIIENICKNILIISRLSSKLEFNKLIDKYYKPLIKYTYNNNMIRNLSDTSILCSIREENEQSKIKQNYLFRCLNCEIGFITTEFKCMNCNKQFCNNCLIELSDGHECIKDDVDNLKFILSQTKPCPNCYTRISKISGCNQMFCTFCHKGFDWVTGKLIEFNFHNPHRLEWIQNGGLDNLNDGFCHNNYQMQIINHNAPTNITKLLYYSNHITDKLAYYNNSLNQIQNETSLNLYLIKYLYGKYCDKNKIEPKIKVLNKNEFKTKIKHLEFQNVKILLYIETYQTISEIIRSTLIRIDQLVIASRVLFDDSINMIDYINNNNEIQTLYNNCLNIISEIESTRINELETYLNLTFDRLLIDERTNVYIWNTGNGFKSLNDILTWYNVLSKRPTETVYYDKIPKINDTRKIYKQINYVDSLFKLPTYAYKNVWKLPISSDDKQIIYNILTGFK